MARDEDVEQPPPAPEIDRRFRLHGVQWVGIPILLLIPVLALFGVFGERWQSVSGETTELSVALDYPSSYRYHIINSLRMEVTNRTEALLDTVTIDLDTSYIEHFSNVSGVPPLDHAYALKLLALEPGETRRVRVELRGERYGRHEGVIRVTGTGADTVRLPVSTFIFP